MRHLTPRKLKHYLDSTTEPPLLLDVRQPWEYQICHIADSQLLPMSQLPQQLEQLNPQQETVLICHHGVRSRQAAYFLENNGFTNVVNLMGGIAAWAEEVDADMPTY